MGDIAGTGRASAPSQETAQLAARLRGSLDQSALTHRHWTVYFTVALGHFLDGFDILMIGLVLPGIISTFSLRPAQAGVLASSVFSGMLVGTLIVGPLADRFGRKPALITAVCLYCVLSIAAGLSQSYDSLLALRVLQGVGLGAEVPMVFTYLSEYMPTRPRGFLLASSVFFWQLSTFVASFIAIYIIPHYSWRGMFIVAAIPAVILIILWARLPESVRFLIERGKLRKAEAIVTRISTMPLSSIKVPAATAPAVEPARMRELLHGNYIKPTLGIWLMQFAGGGVFIALVIWMPTIFARMGFSVVKSFAFTGLIAGAGAIGNLGGGWLIDRIGRRAGVSAFYVAGGILMFLWGTATTTSSILILGALTTFFGAGAAGGPLFAYTSEIYPTRFRGAGTGWAAAWQRIGGLVAPPVFGALLGIGASNYTFFAVMGVVLLVGGIGGYLLGYETRGKSLEDITAHLAG